MWSDCYNIIIIIITYDYFYYHYYYYYYTYYASTIFRTWNASFRMSPRRIFKDASQPAGPTLEEALAQVDLSEDEVDPAGEAFRENWQRGMNRCQIQWQDEDDVGGRNHRKLCKNIAVFCLGPFDFFNFILKHQMLHMFLLCVEFRLQTCGVTVLFILFVKNRYV